jgi:hypothetical protein
LGWLREIYTSIGLWGLYHEIKSKPENEESLHRARSRNRWILLAAKMRNSRKGENVNYNKEAVKNFFIVKSEYETIKYFKVGNRVYKDKTCNMCYFQRLYLENSAITKRE